MPGTRAPAVTPAQFTTFGDLLKFLRRRAGLTQRELSIALGYSTSQISRLEQNERPPDAASLAARFVPALQLETEPDWAARLLELAAASRTDEAPPRPEPAPLSFATPNNLPIQLTSFIGRESDIAQVKEYLAASRLVTLTGPGGAGKTRLALRVAADLLASFPDGVWMVDLAPLAEPALVSQTVATVLGVHEQAGSPILATLTHCLRGRTTLLIVDNCEHLIAACAHFAETVLGACIYVRLLAASREVLDAAGETTFPVPPLTAPDSGQRTPLDALAQYEAVRLFVDRARRVLPSFELTDTNAPAVAQVCFELDGLPLAIEMAAARVKLLRVEQIAERLNDRFQLLTGGRRTALPRHQTLAAVLDWSYELLSEPERALLRRLAVFAGGWTLVAAEQVGGDESGRIGTSAVLDLLTGLVNKSLVVAMRKSGQETRYYSLETIRQYGLARLVASGELEAVQRRHAQYYRSLAETIGPLLSTAQARHGLDQVAVDLENFRKAAKWGLSREGDVNDALRIASALFIYWYTRGAISEGYAWLTAGLATDGILSDPVRAKAAGIAGWLAQFRGDFEDAARRFDTSLNLARAIGDLDGVAWATSGLGTVAWNRRDDDTAQAMSAESLALFRSLDDKFGVASQLTLLGHIARARGDLIAAQTHYVHSQELFAQLGYEANIADLRMSLGHIARARGDYAQAARLYDQALAAGRDLDDQVLIMETRIGQARLAQYQGAYSDAKARLREAMVIVRDYDYNTMGGYCLAGYGGIAAAEQRSEIAVRLLSASAAWREAIGKRMAASMEAEYDRDLAAAREQLGEAAFAAAWAEGQAMTPEQAIELALRT